MPGRHQRRQDQFRGVRDGLRHRPRGGMLRAPEGQARRRDVFQPLSTGITFALTEKAPVDKIPLITAGYGRSESQNGAVFTWNFPLLGTYWVGADVAIQHIAKKEGGVAKLKGKKIALVYHDSPYGKEPIPVLRGTEQELWFRSATVARGASRRRAEGDLAADPPEQARLRPALGLGGDELDRAARSAGDWLSARPRCWASGGLVPSPMSGTSAKGPRAIAR
jgi:hypothetical protein